MLGPQMQRLPIHVQELAAKDGDTIAQTVVKVLEEIWPSPLPKHQLRELVTDGASPMLRCGEILKSQGFSQMQHVYCMVHKVHNIAEEIKKQFPIVFEFTGLLKQVLARSKKRNDMLKALTGGIQLIIFML